MLLIPSIAGEGSCRASKTIALSSKEMIERIAPAQALSGGSTGVDAPRHRIAR